MDEATQERMLRWGDELLALMHRHLDHQPDSHLAEFVWRGGFAMLLAEMIRRDRMSPAEMEVYLDRICAELRSTTTELVRLGDASGWRLPQDGGWPVPPP